MVRWVSISLMLCSAAHAAQWESSLASVASLRTGGASLVSSDSIALDRGQLALITYWETRSDADLDVYRCVDITDPSFVPVRQECWRALRPTGRAPRVAEGVTSDEDLCGEPSAESAVGVIAFCAFSEPFVVRTPHFELTLTPFEKGGLVAARENGRRLLVTDDVLPASVFFEVRANGRGAFPELARLAEPEDFLLQPPDGLECRLDEIARRQWVACQSIESPASVIHYLMADGVVYTVTYDFELSREDERVVDVMFSSLRPGPH